MPKALRSVFALTSGDALERRRRRRTSSRRRSCQPCSFGGPTSSSRGCLGLPLNTETLAPCPWQWPFSWPSSSSPFLHRFLLHGLHASGIATTRQQRKRAATLRNATTQQQHNNNTTRTQREHNENTTTVFRFSTRLTFFMADFMAFFIDFFMAFFMDLAIFATNCYE